MTKIVGLKDVLLPRNQFVNEEIFGIVSLRNGIITIRINNAESIHQVAQKVNRCFTMASIFTNLRAVRFRYNGIEMYVDNSYSTTKEIVEQYYRKFRKAKEREENTGDYFNTRHLYSVYRRKYLKEMILEAMENEKMLFKNSELETGWNFLSQKAKDDLTSSRVIYFAECLAKYVQFLIKKHPNANIEFLADSALWDCEVIDISIPIHKKAICLLFEYWEYGNCLKGWM